MPSRNASKVPIGTVLEGKFRITQEIGRGGMAAVYEAENVDIGKRVAVKILAAELITSRVVRERFIREARAAASIRSPYICDVFDSGMFDERPFLVMELLEGESLYDRMTRVRQMKVETVIKIASQVARGLQKAHEQGIVHRDLKPENIFLTRDEDGKLLSKIVDFGLAKFYEGQGEEKNVRLTREGALFGTPAYMSPEQAKGQGEVDHRADLWALGCIVYECLTGQTVWNVEQGVAMILAQIAGAPLPVPSKLRPDLPPSFDEWFLRALDRDATKRYQTAKSFAESLRRAFAGESSKGRAPAPSDVEGSVVDALMAGRPLPMTPNQAALSSAASSTGSSSAGFPPSPPRSPSPVDIPDELHSRGAAAAIGWLLALSLLALGGYALWFYVLHPPGGGLFASASRSSDSASGSASVDRRPVEDAPYAKKIARAQEVLLQGDVEAAIASLEEAEKEGGKVVGRSLLAHTEAGFEKPPGACRLAGIGRPRPFSVQKPASHPTLVRGPEGFLAAWTDSHEDFKRRQLYTALLDDALRRITPIRNVSPEASTALYPELFPEGRGFVVIYWDSGSKDPGVFVRRLESDGRIGSPAQRLSSPRKDKYYPTLAMLPGGGYLALWSESHAAGAPLNIVARRLNRDLEPLGDRVPLTAFTKGQASQTAATIAAGQLFVAFTYGDNLRSVRLLRIPIDDPGLEKGVTPNAKTPYLGELVEVHGDGKHSRPSLRCDGEGCIMVWDDEDAGALAAFVPHDQKEPLWHRDFATDAFRPSLASSPKSGKVVAYFADQRVHIAPISRDGVGASSIISRVSGFQPAPSIVADEKAGDWVIAWRDYEAGHLEVFVARARCETGGKP